MIPEDFVVTGTCSEQLYGMCESLWEPDMVCYIIICHLDNDGIQVANHLLADEMN